MQHKPKLSLCNGSAGKIHSVFIEESLASWDWYSKVWHQVWQRHNVDQTLTLIGWRSKMLKAYFWISFSAKVQILFLDRKKQQTSHYPSCGEYNVAWYAVWIKKLLKKVGCRLWDSRANSIWPLDYHGWIEHAWSNTPSFKNSFRTRQWSLEYYLLDEWDKNLKLEPIKKSIWWERNKQRKMN